MERSTLITGVLMSEIAHSRSTLTVSCRLSSRGELISAYLALPRRSALRLHRKLARVATSPTVSFSKCVMRFRDRIVSSCVCLERGEYRYF